MALAPLARTLLMREGSAPGVITAPIKIPDAPLRSNLDNTLGKSDLPSSRVAGEAAMYNNELYPALRALAARKEAARVRIAALAARAAIQEAKRG